MVEFETLEIAGTNPVCGTCKHCTAVVYGKSQKGFEMAAIIKTPDCRKYPPFLGAFPLVNPLMDFCGGYSPRSQEEINSLADEVRKQTQDSKVTIGMEVQ